VFNCWAACAAVCSLRCVGELQLGKCDSPPCRQSLHQAYYLGQGVVGTTAAMIVDLGAANNVQAKPLLTWYRLAIRGPYLYRCLTAHCCTMTHGRFPSARVLNVYGSRGFSMVIGPAQGAQTAILRC
jgi:hypothetical protein